MAQRSFRPIVLFNDLAPSSLLKHDTQPPIPSHTSLAQRSDPVTQQQLHQSKPYDKDGKRDDQRQSQEVLESPSNIQRSTPEQVKDMDMNMDMDVDEEDGDPTSKYKVSKENSDQGSDGNEEDSGQNNGHSHSENRELDLQEQDNAERDGTDRHRQGDDDGDGDDGDENHLTSGSSTAAVDIKRKSGHDKDNSSNSGNTSHETPIVSPPSSYSSNSSSSSSSSSMDALAKTLSPARVDIHRKRIQRMLQQNSLLWWELVRYTRNLERKEREKEQEQEQQRSSANQLATMTQTRSLHHYHHHIHHYQPALPPLHPQQQTTTTSKSPSSLKSRGGVNSSQPRLPYEYPSDDASRTQIMAGDRRSRIESSSSYQFDRGEYGMEDPRDPEGRGMARRYSGTAGAPTSHTPSRSSSPITSPTTSPGVRSYESRSQEDVSPSSQHPPYPQQHRHQQQYPSVSHPSHVHPYGQDEYMSRPHDLQEGSSRPYGSKSTMATTTRTTAKTSESSSSSTKLLTHPAMEGLLPSPLNSVGPHSSGPSSTESSPRMREFSSSGASGYPQQYHPHHHQHPNQQQAREPYYQRHSQHDSGSYTLERPGGQRGLHSSSSSPPPPGGGGGAAAASSTSSRTEFAPHHHHHHHHHHSQQATHSRPQAVMDTLPRPVPLKPASFGNPVYLDSGHVHETSVGHRHPTLAPKTATVTSNSDSHPSVDVHSNSNLAACSTSSTSNSIDPNRKRRGNLPKSVTSVLKSWLVQNAIHPYPSEAEKMRLAEATQLSMNQISNWFINARRRILQPILDEAAAAAAASSDAPVENVLIVRKGKGSRMQVEMEGVTTSHASTSAVATATATLASTSAPASTTTVTSVDSDTDIHSATETEGPHHQQR